MVSSMTFLDSMILRHHESNFIKRVILKEAGRTTSFSRSGSPCKDN